MFFFLLLKYLHPKFPTFHTGLKQLVKPVAGEALKQPQLKMLINHKQMLCAEQPIWLEGPQVHIFYGWYIV